MDGQKLNLQVDPLLLSFLQTTDEAEAQCCLDRLISLATPTIKKVTSWTRDPEDAFQETAQHLVERLWDFKANPAHKPINNYFHYVNVVASRVSKGQLRDKNRQRRSIVDALRYVLKGNRQFAIWENENRERLCGIAAWRHQEIGVTRSERLAALLNHSQKFDEVISQAYDAQNLNHVELLIEIFNWVSHPIKYGDLVRIVCHLTHAEDLAPVIEADREVPHSLSKFLPDANPQPDDVAEWSEILKRLWIEIEQLPLLQRIAYLLNFTAGDGQLELFWIYNIVDIRGIGAALKLTDDQFMRAWTELGLNEDRRRLKAVISYDEKFALLWQHLPLTDRIIAKMLGTQHQKVINLRKAASKRLSQRLTYQ